MSKWHYDYTDEIKFSNPEDCRNGGYLVYNSDTFDYLLNDPDWLRLNDAFDERSYVLDHLDLMRESNDGELIFIPDYKTALRIEMYYAEV